MTQEKGIPYRRHKPSAELREFLDPLDPGSYFDCGQARLHGLDDDLLREAESRGRQIGNDSFQLVATDMGLIFCRPSISFAIAARWEEITLIRPHGDDPVVLPVTWPTHGELRFTVSKRLAGNVFRRWLQLRMQSERLVRREKTDRFTKIEREGEARPDDWELVTRVEPPEQVGAGPSSGDVRPERRDRGAAAKRRRQNHSGMAKRRLRREGSTVSMPPGLAASARSQAAPVGTQAGRTQAGRTESSQGQGSQGQGSQGQGGQKQGGAAAPERSRPAIEQPLRARQAPADAPPTPPALPSVRTERSERAPQARLAERSPAPSSVVGSAVDAGPAPPRPPGPVSSPLAEVTETVSMERGIEFDPSLDTQADSRDAADLASAEPTVEIELRDGHRGHYERSGHGEPEDHDDETVELRLEDEAGTSDAEPTIELEIEEAELDQLDQGEGDSGETDLTNRLDIADDGSVASPPVSPVVSTSPGASQVNAPALSDWPPAIEYRSSSAAPPVSSSPGSSMVADRSLDVEEAVIDLTDHASALEPEGDNDVTGRLMAPQHQSAVDPQTGQDDLDEDPAIGVPSDDRPPAETVPAAGEMASAGEGQALHAAEGNAPGGHSSVRTIERPQATQPSWVGSPVSLVGAMVVISTFVLITATAVTSYRRSVDAGTPIASEAVDPAGSSRTTVDHQRFNPDVSSVVSPPSTASTSRTVPAENPVEAPADDAVLEGGPRLCNSNYSGCVPDVSDVDCPNDGDGPLYSTEAAVVMGEDVYDLDTDDDGETCELDQPRQTDLEAETTP